VTTIALASTNLDLFIFTSSLAEIVYLEAVSCQGFSVELQLNLPSVLPVCLE